MDLVFDIPTSIIFVHYWTIENSRIYGLSGIELIKYATKIDIATITLPWGLSCSNEKTSALGNKVKLNSDTLYIFRHNLRMRVLIFEIFQFFMSNIKHKMRFWTFRGPHDVQIRDMPHIICEKNSNDKNLFLKWLPKTRIKVWSQSNKLGFEQSNFWSWNHENFPIDRGTRSSKES